MADRNMWHDVFGYCSVWINQLWIARGPMRRLKFSRLQVHADVLRLCIFFFFQAEDGIRDLTVTGVQTCALPISTIMRLGRVVAECDPRVETARRLAELMLGGELKLPTNPHRNGGERRPRLDRESGVEGKRVDLGGRRIIKKKKRQRTTTN